MQKVCYTQSYVFERSRLNSSNKGARVPYFPSFLGVPSPLFLFLLNMKIVFQPPATDFESAAKTAMEYRIMLATMMRDMTLNTKNGDSLLLEESEDLLYYLVTEISEWIRLSEITLYAKFSSPQAIANVFTVLKQDIHQARSNWLLEGGEESRL